MPLEIKHYDDATSDAPITWDGAKSATVDMALKGTATYPGATKLFDSDVSATDPVLVYHGQQEGGLPDRPTLEDLEAAVSTPGSKLPLAAGDLFITTRIAQHVVRQVRRVLPKGALNAVYMLAPNGIEEGQPADYEREDAPLGYVCGRTSPAHLNFKHLNAFTTGACRGDHWCSLFDQLLVDFYATLHVQSGVCNMVSAVAMGIASLSATPGAFDPAKPLTILRVSHVGKHSFCLLSYGQSPWIVVDPWCAEVYTCPVEHNAFGPEGIRAYTQIDFFKRFDHPFGIPLLRKWEDGHLDAPAVAGLGFTAADLRAAVRQADALRVANEDDMVLGGGDVMRWDGSGWEENRALHYDNGMGREWMFHMNQHVWQEQTNLNKKGAAYAEHFSKHPPVVMGHHWGENVPNVAHPREALR